MAQQSYLFQNIEVSSTKECKPSKQCSDSCPFFGPTLFSTSSPEHMIIKRQRSFDKATWWQISDRTLTFK